MLTIHSWLRISGVLVMLFFIMSMTACVTTQTPKISHVHIGHAMTAWRGTPDEQGLFVTAELEAVTALEHAQYAVASTNDLSVLKMHIRHVQHAMDPELVKEGPGTGYGFIKALNGARDHLLFAADSKDASENIKRSANGWSNNVDGIIQRSRLILALSKEILSVNSHAEIIVLTEEVKLLAQHNLYGYDSDGDGTLAGKVEYGIKQLKEDIQLMIAREDPPYQSVEKKYLFGLIRLPDGEWIFDFNKNTDNSSGFQY